MEADFFDPMLSGKTFATNSLKQTFMWEVWFDGQIVYSKIEHLSNIDEIDDLGHLQSNLQTYKKIG